jgi:hypothetical protein
MTLGLSDVEMNDDQIISTCLSTLLKQPSTFSDILKRRTDTPGHKK